MCLMVSCVIPEDSSSRPPNLWQVAIIDSGDDGKLSLYTSEGGVMVGCDRQLDTRLASTYQIRVLYAMEKTLSGG